MSVWCGFRSGRFRWIGGCPARRGFSVAVRWWIFSCEREQHLLVFVMLEVVLDGERELGEVAVADDLPKLPFGFEHAGGGPAQAHVARLPALDVARGAADDLDHRLARVRR